MTIHIGRVALRMTYREARERSKKHLSSALSCSFYGSGHRGNGALGSDHTLVDKAYVLLFYQGMGV